MEEFDIPEEELQRIREEAEAKHRAEQEQSRQSADANRQEEESVPEKTNADPKQQAAERGKRVASQDKVRRGSRLRRAVLTAGWFIGGVVLFFVVAGLSVEACKRWVSEHLDPAPRYMGKSFEEWTERENETKDSPDFRTPKAQQWLAEHRVWRKNQRNVLTAVGLGSGLVFVCFYYMLYKEFGTTE